LKLGLRNFWMSNCLPVGGSLGKITPARLGVVLYRAKV
jgi:hypothetical protein